MVFKFLCQLFMRMWRQHRPHGNIFVPQNVFTGYCMQVAKLIESLKWSTVIERVQRARYYKLNASAENWVEICTELFFLCFSEYILTHIDTELLLSL